MIGRSYIYGLGAGGEAGVAKAIEILGKELDVTMALSGVRNVQRHRPQGDRVSVTPAARHFRVKCRSRRTAGWR